MTYYFETYGCQMNTAESASVEQLFIARGWKRAPSAQVADCAIINTCSVRATAENRIYGRLGWFDGLKALRAREPHAKSKSLGEAAEFVKDGAKPLTLIVMGCMAERLLKSLKKDYPFIDYVVGTYAKNQFGKIISEIEEKDRPTELDDTIKYQFAPLSYEPGAFTAFVPIMHGCNNFCTYCIVPYVRGRERSREKSLILDEARQMISAGYKDITLLGQNVNSYGKTLADKPTFAQLLHEIDSIDGDYWLRFMTSHPKDCSKELIDTIANGTHISKHLHLPFQSGSDRILKAMNRHYDRKKYLDIVNYAKEKIDGVSLTSDIIVGFPGETYEDFKETLSLIREVEFTSLFTFIYSPRVGTPAAKMDDPISAEEKSKWFRELLDVQEEIAAKRCASMVNNTEKVLIESETGKNGELNGRTSGNIIVELKGDKSLIGTFQNVKITQARNWILKGELV